VQGDVSTKAGALDIATKLKGLVDHVSLVLSVRVEVVEADD
jgi:hypothetical protein